MTLPDEIAATIREVVNGNCDINEAISYLLEKVYVSPVEREARVHSAKLLALVRGGKKALQRRIKLQKKIG